MLVFDKMQDGKSAYLKAADEAIRNIVLEKVSSLVVYAGPTPHVLVVVLRFALVESGCTHSPHDNAENEESDGEDCVVGGYLLCFVVPTSPIGDHYNDGHDEGDDGNGKEQDLRPDFRVFSPGWKIVSCWESLGGVKDGESCSDHGKHDETACKVDAS